MAITTRSKATGDRPETKKRAAKYAEDESASEESEDEAAPKRNPKKRAKRDQSNGAVARKPAARTRKRGRLNALPEMPLDILEAIFSLLDPSDLIRIARTTKAFRRLLLTGNQFSHLWRASWSRMDGYPPCPEDFSLLQWLQLLFGGPYCQACTAPSVQHIFFGIRARMCKSCLRNTLVYVGSTWIETIRPPFLKYYIPAVSDGKNIYAYEHDLDNLRTAISSGLDGVESSTRDQTLTTLLRSQMAAFAPRVSHVRVCDAWQDRMAESRKDSLSERRASRREDILSRLEELGYTKSDVSGIWRLKDVNVSKPLTNLAWGILLPTLLPTLDRARDLRLERDRRERRSRRVDAAQAGYTDILRSGAVKPKDIPYLPKPTACIQFGSLPSLIDEDEDEISTDWNQRLDIALHESVPLMQAAFDKHQEEFASLILGDDEKASNPSHILSLASSVFVVLGPYGERTVCFGREAVARSEVQSYHSSPAANYSKSRLSRVVDPTPESVLKGVRAILRLLELDDTATILELDTLDPCFICMSCKARYEQMFVYHDGIYHDLQYRQGMNWRDVVAHFLTEHNDNADDVRIHCLTNNEREAIGAEGTVLGGRRQQRANYNGLAIDSFACCHCVEPLLHPNFAEMAYFKYLTMEGIRLHLAQSHGIEAADEGVDFFHDPRDHRGVLGGIRAQFCLVEEDGPKKLLDKTVEAAALGEENSTV